MAVDFISHSDGAFLEWAGLYEDATEYLTLTDDIKKLAAQFQRYDIKEYDSLHLATAEINGYDFFLTTDDDFLRNALKLGLNVQVRNPAQWILEEVGNVPNNNN
jgi:predicted nucleic acid-binding protein